MPYLAIDDFKSGLDARKSTLTAPPGSLTRLVNAVVSPGGEIEKRRAFVKVASLAGTKGLAAIGNKVVAFSAAPPAAPNLGMATASLEFHTIPGLTATSKMIDQEVFDGNLYATFFDSAGATAQTKNPHYYFDATKADGHTPTNAYVKTEGSGKGYYVRAYQSKMYAVNDKYIYFSSIKYPLLWDEAPLLPPSGAYPVSVLPIQGAPGEQVIISSKKKLYTWTVEPATGVGNWVESAPSAADLAWISDSSQRTGGGYINTALQESGGTGLQGIEIYYDKLAVMSGETTQLWSMDPDPNQNALAQVLRNNGTRAPKSVQQYGSGDVLYLGSSGIRSLKARDASNSASVTDIGSPVDALVTALSRQYGRTYLANCISINEPVIGRFWAVFPDQIFVLSYFPGPQVTAWSTFTVPFAIDYVVTAGDHIFLRSGDDLYLFGGKTGAEFDSCPVEVRFPYLDAGKPAHNKIFNGIDATVEGDWQGAVSYNFDMPDAEEPIGTLIASTWNKGRFALQGYGTHISMRFYNEAPGPARIANAAIHYTVADDEA